MHYNEIEQYTGDGNYRIDVSLKTMDVEIRRYVETYGLTMDVDFQRGHVWTLEQQTRFIEHLLKGGDGGIIRFNHPNWMGSFEGQFVVVDGKQRITACLAFLNHKVWPFGTPIDEFEGNIPLKIGLRLHINNLKTRREVLKWYLEINAGGTPHTDDELNKVRDLLGIEETNRT